MKEIYLEQDLNQNPVFNSQIEESIFPEAQPAEGSVPLTPCDLSIWAESGVDIAITCLERVRGSLIRSAELFREEDVQLANRFFIQCVEGLQRFMETIKRTKAALQLDFSKVQTEIGNLADTEKSLLFILKGMFQNQQAKQYSEIADKIDYELITNLSTWLSTLKIMRQNQTNWSNQ
jgi:hypothetical protein